MPPLVAGRAIEEVADSLEGDQLGTDHVAAYDASAELAAAAFEAPGARTAPCAVSYGPRQAECSARPSLTVGGSRVTERVTGIEPALSAWEADVLPLNYTRERLPDGWRTCRG